MRINWVGWDFSPFDGYGRFSINFVRALQRAGVDVRPVLANQLRLPGWLQRQAGLDFSWLTISCVPPYALHAVPGRHWQFTMTEGSALPAGWADDIEEAGVERVIVPCAWNERAFRTAGRPVDVVPGGTCPVEFPVCRPPRAGSRPYTFMALADRGARKGWSEVWRAFYKAFGPADDEPDVRLVIKSRPPDNRTGRNQMLDVVAGAQNRDPRISFWMQDVDRVSDIYAQADCFVVPSRAEGWGMPHREATMMGVPVICPDHSGLSDAGEWASVVLKRYQAGTIPSQHDEIAGEWYRADIDELAGAMRWCYEQPDEARQRAVAGSDWLRRNQTWDHAATKLMELIERHG